MYVQQVDQQQPVQYVVANQQQQLNPLAFNQGYTSPIQVVSQHPGQVAPAGLAQPQPGVVVIQAPVGQPGWNGQQAFSRVRLYPTEIIKVY